MLSELHVRDLGVISDVTVQLGSGMTALTGETGAGKTLLVAALQLVLGGRATAGLVRAGAKQALVDARFEHGVGERRAETILSRTVPMSGRSRAWVDGRMVPVTALSELGDGLVDIHGQHDQQSLLSVTGQRVALDQFAHADHGPLDAARQALAQVHRQLDALGGSPRERARRLDLLRYQEAEIAAAGLDDVDEEAALEAEAERLESVRALRAAAAKGAALLDDDDAGTLGTRGATAQVGEAVRVLGGHGPLASWERRLRGALAELADVAT